MAQSESYGKFNVTKKQEDWLLASLFSMEEKIGLDVLMLDELKLTISDQILEDSK